MLSRHPIRRGRLARVAAPPEPTPRLPLPAQTLEGLARPGLALRGLGRPGLALRGLARPGLASRRLARRRWVDPGWAAYGLPFHERELCRLTFCQSALRRLPFRRLVGLCATAVDWLD